MHHFDFDCSHLSEENKPLTEVAHQVLREQPHGEYMNTILLITGLLSIYFGYRLFCSYSRRSLKTIAGALLAMFGMSILVGEARAFVGHRREPVSGVHRSTSWHNGAAHSVHSIPHPQNIA